MGSGIVFVTGATGFLGHNLVTHLLAAGYQVRALVRPTSQTEFLSNAGVELVVGDVQDAASVQKGMAGAQYVVHAAGLFRFWGDATEFEKTNARGSSNIMEAALRHNVEKLVHISTIAVVGNPPSGIIIDENTPCKPADAYQRSKLDGENFIRMFSKGTRFPAVVLRPGAFYGPWGHYAFNRLFFEDPLKGLRIQVHWGQRITFPVFVPDVARAIMAAFKGGKPGDVYNISGDSMTHKEANATVSRLAGILPWRINVPEKWIISISKRWTEMAERTKREPYYPLNMTSYVFNDWRVSSEKAKTELGFVPTPFEEGALQTLEWYWDTGQFRRPLLARHRSIAQPAPAVSSK